VAIAIAPHATSAQSVSVKLVAFNDLHGHLQSPGKLASGAGQSAVSVGGIDYLAAYVAQRISLNPNHVVVAAGDLIGASPLISAAYHDEATIEALNRLGLDFSSVGNHEFDAGQPELLRKQSGGCFAAGTRTCLEHGAFPGARFQYLAANVVSTRTGKTLFPPYAIKRFGGVRIAFVGVVLRTTPNIVLPRSVVGLEFRDEADSVNALVPQLQAKGIHAIVVLIHQGGEQLPERGSSSHSINDCAGQLGTVRSSPILDVVGRLSDAVDLVISGHTHTAYNCRLPNSEGRLIPVTQASAYGRVLTDIDLTLDPRSGRMTAIVATNMLVSQPDADAATSAVHPFLLSANVTQIRQLVADYAAALAPVANQVLGSIAAPLTNIAAATGEEPAGDLVADAQLAVTSPADAGGAVISFVNAGGVRSPGFDLPNVSYPHEVTYQEAFEVRPFGNTLLTMTLTAQNIRDLLEQEFPGCQRETGESILQVSNGFHFEWSASAPPCRKIINASLNADAIVVGGVVQHPQKTYRVSVDNFMASGQNGFSVLLQGTDQITGPQDVDALVAFLTSTHKAPARPYDPTAPDLHRPRIVKLP
jgi:5'-nucleotidase